MLEKLFGVGSFGGSINHLVHCQASLLTFLGELGLSFVVQTIALTFLGCWALIIFAFVIHFRHDDHPIFLDAIVHVKTNIFQFQMSLQNIEPYYPKLFVLKSHLLRAQWFSFIPIISLFGRSLTRVGICFASSRHSFKYHMNMSSFMCSFTGKRLVINSSTALAFHLSSIHLHYIPILVCHILRLPIFHSVNVVIPLTI